MSEIYTCEECGKEQEISISEVDDYNDSDSLADKILEGEDYGPLGYAFPGCAGTVNAEIEATVPCKHCEEYITVSISVSATPVWDDSRDDRDPSIDYYTDVEIEEVIPQGSGTGGVNVNSLLSVYGNTDDDFDEFPDIIDTVVHHSEPESINLHILVKTRMNNGYCHLGFDEKTRRIYRPLYRPNAGQCCWDTGLTVDSLYSFRVKRFPNDGKVPFTPLPHNNEDLLVTPNVTPQAASRNLKEIFKALESLGKSSVEQIFNDLQDNKYVKEGQDSPSAGILKCQGAEIRYYVNNWGKSRIQLGHFDFSYTGLESVPNLDPMRPALVLLGLGRPWGGKPNGTYVPKRCYVLALRVLQY